MPTIDGWNDPYGPRQGGPQGQGPPASAGTAGFAERPTASAASFPASSRMIPVRAARWVLGRRDGLGGEDRLPVPLSRTGRQARPPCAGVDRRRSGRTGRWRGSVRQTGAPGVGRQFRASRAGGRPGGPIARRARSGSDHSVGGEGRLGTGPARNGPSRRRGEPPYGDEPAPAGGAGLEVLGDGGWQAREGGPEGRRRRPSGSSPRAPRLPTCPSDLEGEPTGTTTADAPQVRGETGPPDRPSATFVHCPRTGG